MSDAQYISTDPLVISSNATHTTTWSGVWLSAQSGNVKYVILDNAVVILIPTITATATVATSVVMDTAFPTNIRPATQQFFIVRNINGGTIATGNLTVNTDGTINFFRNAASANFTGSGSTGMYATALTYLLV